MIEESPGTPPLGVPVPLEPRVGDDRQSREGVAIDELRHRFRNHLQTMTSLVGLQARRVRHPEAREAMEDLKARFETLSSIYVDLDDAGTEEAMPSGFLASLVDKIAQLYDPRACFRVEMAIEAMSMARARASVLGQILTELLINAYRHAFSGRERGRIRISLARLPDGSVELAVADDGPGMGLPDPGRTHLGLSIVTNLARGLGGVFEHGSEAGFVGRARFPPTPSASR